MGAVTVAHRLTAAMGGREARAPAAAGRPTSGAAPTSSMTAFSSPAAAAAESAARTARAAEREEPLEEPKASRHSAWPTLQPEATAGRGAPAVPPARTHR